MGDSKTFRKANFEENQQESQQEVDDKKVKGFGGEYSLSGDWPMHVQDFYAENEANFMDKEFSKVDKINEI